MELALVLALASALCWGAGDFFGGLATRDSPAVGTTFTAQATGLIGLVLVSIALGTQGLATSDLLWGVGAGLSAVTGLGLFYEAMGRGPFGPVVSVTSVVSAVVPILVGTALGERPALAVYAGIAIAVVAIWLIAGESRKKGEANASRQVLALALAAGGFFGGYFVLLSRSGGGSGLWPVAAGRAAASIAVLALIAVLRVRTPGKRQLPTRRSGRLCMIGGVLDASANALYFLAIGDGLLSVVAVLASMYPASTLLLARFGLGERMNRRRLAGMAVGLFAVSVIAGGSGTQPHAPDLTPLEFQLPGDFIVREDTGIAGDPIEEASTGQGTVPPDELALEDPTSDTIIMEPSDDDELTFRAPHPVDMLEFEEPQRYDAPWRR